MRKILLFIITILIFIPTFVFAATCDSTNVVVENIKLIETGGMAKELSKATAEGKSINLNLDMSFQGDYVEYELTIKNGAEEDYVLDKSMFNNQLDYFDYVFETNDNYIKSAETRTIKLKVEYKTMLDGSKFTNGKTNIKDDLLLNLSGSKLDENPETGIKNLLIVIPIILVIAMIGIMINKKKSMFKTMVLLLCIIAIPSVYAICSCQLKIESNININECKYKLVTNEGSFSQDEDVKAICANSLFTYKDEYYQYDDLHLSMQPGYDAYVRVHIEDFDDQSFVRVYEDSSKTHLLTEVIKDDFPKRYYKIEDGFYTGLYYFDRTLGNYSYPYLEMSSDLNRNSAFIHYGREDEKIIFKDDDLVTNDTVLINKIKNLIRTNQGFGNHVQFTNCPIYDGYELKSDSKCEGNVYYAYFTQEIAILR